ncbi:DUF6318 family protein [Cellulomonas xiejunii]|uniref:DUF6318 family protein n=1 Tax=Cellulomonas xiejunii TaxID=2968083 RepID=A0ABY5KQY6_9CELL|nr:DUF6318 family protein [Cellulomonas xiejunii]MCC2319554.1 DUF6318 family protein [Cellulomonas xiejunii]UUI71500.1 DUF6318 family protein [Cellulomonas xiejunii]
MPKTGWAWRRAATTLALTTLLAVGGCVGAEPADVPTTPTAEETPTPTPSATADLTQLPEKPAAMAEPTTDGAIAAATYVLDLYGYTFATRDTAPWRAMALDTCGFCTEVTTSVNGMVDAGETSSGSTFTVTSSKSVEISEDQWFSVDLTIIQSPSQRFGASGEPVGSGTGGEHRAVFALSWSDGWRVDEMGVLPLEESSEAVG